MFGLTALLLSLATEPLALQSQAKFQPTVESLKNYRCPDWFRDAKFGIWAHWGPQSVPMMGDWYARNMFIQGSGQYEDHLKRWGHPSEHGYREIIDQWKAENWDVILLDTQLPGMDGEAVAQMVRSSELKFGWALTPIVGMAPSLSTRDMEHYLACGMDACVAKPIEAQSLIAAIEEAMSVRDRAAAAGDWAFSEVA
jgi:CheY-like chemotaxis protein